MTESETKRLFTALFPPSHVVRLLQAAVAGLEKGIPARAIRWTRPGQIHLTLNFLGAVATARVPKIESAFRAACDAHRSHPVRVAGLGCFPNWNRPRIIWAGLAGDLRPVENLKKALDASFLACGCAGEDRPFHPHLTIGRVGDLNAEGRKALAEALAREQERDFGEWEVGNAWGGCQDGR